jgi:Flp pilus assembly protein protease CpaA
MERTITFFFCAVVSLIDIKTRRIPDIILVSWALYMFLFDIFTKNAFMGEKIASGSLLFMLFYFLYRGTGSTGFGDVKLAGLIGYALNLDKLPLFCFFSAVFCLCMYLIGILWYHWDKSARLPFAPFMRERKGDRHQICLVSGKLDYGIYSE